MAEINKKHVAIGGLLLAAGSAALWSLRGDDPGLDQLTLPPATAPDRPEADLLSADGYEVAPQGESVRQLVEVPNQGVKQGGDPAISQQLIQFHTIEVFDDRGLPVADARVRVAIPNEVLSQPQSAVEQGRRGNGPRGQRGQNVGNEDSAERAAAAERWRQMAERNFGQRGMAQGNVDWSNMPQGFRGGRGLGRNGIMEARTNDSGLAELQLLPEQLDRLKSRFEPRLGGRELFPNTFQIEVSHQYHRGAELRLDLTPQDPGANNIPRTRVVLMPGMVAAGQVIDAETRQPVADALVRIGGKSGKTDEGGLIREYGATGPSEGISGFEEQGRTVQSLVDAKGYPPIRKELDLTKFNVIELSKQSVEIQLELRDLLSGQMVNGAGAIVQVSLRDERPAEESQGEAAAPQDRPSDQGGARRGGRRGGGAARPYHSFQYNDRSTADVDIRGPFVTLTELGTAPSGMVQVEVPGYDLVMLNLSELKPSPQNSNVVELRPRISCKVTLREVYAPGEEGRTRPMLLDVWKVENGERSRVPVVARPSGEPVALSDGRFSRDYVAEIRSSDLRLGKGFQTLEIQGVQGTGFQRTLYDSDGRALGQPVQLLTNRTRSDEQPQYQYWIRRTE